MTKVLILDDEYQSIRFEEDSIKLSNISSFFQSLLSDSYRDNNDEEIHIKVDQANIAYRVISSSLGKEINPDQTKIIDEVKMKIYVGIEIDFDLLNILPSSAFMDLIGLIDYVGYHPGLVRIIAKKLPDTIPDVSDSKLLSLLEKELERYYIIVHKKDCLEY